jgi:hypothetical protein
MSTPIILTEAQFKDLQTKMVPVDQLSISDSEKSYIKEEAKKMRKGGGATPDEDPIPLVICRMVGDSVECRVIHTAHTT